MKTVLQIFLFLYIFILFSKKTSSTHLQNGKASRIVGGEATYSGEFPFAVAINIKYENAEFFCGGAFYNQRYVITAASCLYQSTLCTVQLGSGTLKGADPNRVTVVASEYVLHPNFNNVTLDNDIGLLRLRGPVSYTEYIQPIYLPTAEIEQGQSFTSIGWGQTGDFSPDMSNTLMRVTTAALSNDECKLIYGNQITDNMVCVEGNFNEGTCLGDNGTPLLVPYLYRFHYIVGVASFVSGNGCEGTDPSGYTRVFPYVDWIRDVTK